jgi:single-stranded-DNA-specific exonuclease recJ
LPRADVEIGDFSEITEELIENLAKMEPFGNGNPEPVVKITTAIVLSARRMGAGGQHVKLALRDKNSKVLQMLAFNAPEEFFREPGDEVAVWFQPTVNEWQGVRTVEGRLVHVALLD